MHFLTSFILPAVYAIVAGIDLKRHVATVINFIISKSM